MASRARQSSSAGFASSQQCSQSTGWVVSFAPNSAEWKDGSSCSSACCRNSYITLSAPSGLGVPIISSNDSGRLPIDAAMTS